MTIELPHRFGRYTLVEKLAQGGMAEIYRARYEGEGGFVKPVAIKRILPTWSDDPEFVRLLIDEAHALAYLQHQNIVQVYELGKDGAAYFIAMEFVPGVDCRTLLRRLRERQAVLHDGFALFLLAEVLKGLAFAHAQTGARGEAMRFVHRDISPQNILLSFHGEVKIADFGIAKGMHRHEQTAIAQLKGKYAYMAPEQAMAMPVDARADIFSAGVVGYELLTGQPCFDGPSDLAVLERVKQAGLVPGWERQFPPVLRAVLRRALARDPEERYSTAQVFLDEILRYITTQRLLIHGFEWAKYLRTLFPDEVAKVATATAQPPAGAAESRDAITRGYTLADRAARSPTDARARDRNWNGWSILLRPGRRALLGSVAWGFLLPLILGSYRPATAMRSPTPAPSPAQALVRDAPPPQERAKPPPREPAPSDVPMPAMRPPAPAAHAAPKPKPQRGYLSVQVRPWGEVTIPGVAAAREAPVGISVEEGVYTVQVRHAATGRFLAERAHVRSGGKTTCFATFADIPSIRCR